MYDYMMFWVARDLVKLGYALAFISVLFAAIILFAVIRSARQHYSAWRMRSKRHPEYVKMAREIIEKIEWETEISAKAGITHSYLKARMTEGRPAAYYWLFDKVIDDLYESKRIQAEIDTSNDVCVYFTQEALDRRLGKIEAEIEDRKANPQKYPPRKRLVKKVRPLTPRANRW
ncbi:hypothetical protein EVC12_077 [Rhizobium phage RHph_I42]|nr:hypothetical protein EVC12_077 [Rhizobium phage RHph_I42]